MNKKLKLETCVALIAVAGIASVAARKQGAQLGLSPAAVTVLVLAAGIGAQKAGLV